MEPDIFINIINGISPIDADAVDELKRACKLKSFRKGDFLLNADQVCNHYYFIEEGLVKLFFDTGDHDFIMNFFKEHMFFTELSSFNTSVSSKYMLLALTPVTVRMVPKSIIENLATKYHSVETLLRKLNAVATVRMMNRISELLEADGKKRYENFLYHSADLVQRINLGDLADYIGISPVSLSRIRAQK